MVHVQHCSKHDSHSWQLCAKTWILKQQSRRAILWDNPRVDSKLLNEREKGFLGVYCICSECDILLLPLTVFYSKARWYKFDSFPFSHNFLACEQAHSCEFGETFGGPAARTSWRSSLQTLSMIGLMNRWQLASTRKTRKISLDVTSF